MSAKKTYTMTLRVELSIQAADEDELNKIFSGLDMGHLDGDARVSGVGFKEVEDGEAEDEFGNKVAIK